LLAKGIKRCTVSTNIKKGKTLVLSKRGKQFYRRADFLGTFRENFGKIVFLRKNMWALLEA